MHTDLSPHLHTSHCNELIEALKRCHEDHKLAKFVGYCNSFDSAVVKCLKQERIARSAANRAKAREKQAELKRKLQEEEA
ncbi:COX assembly mitochondrial protein 2 homolog [Musca autumnalis]|uniref:COX assembly mitochondrial protein 2 homolog n=1 Tax=Musca autumnalis TaxID=221902 RepID=UPI003CF17F7C